MCLCVKHLPSGISVDILYSLTFSIIPHYFTRWRGMANDIMISGTPVNLLLMPSVFEYFLASFGFRGSILIAGGLALNICVAAMVLHPAERHSKDVPDALTTEIKASSRKDGGESVLDSLLNVLYRSKKNLQLIRSPSVTIICLLYAITYASLLSVGCVLPFAMEDDGFLLEDISYCLTIEGVGFFASRFVTCFLVSKCAMKSQVTMLTGSTIMCTSLVGKITLNQSENLLLDYLKNNS